MTNFQGSLGQRSQEGNVLAQMRSHEFFLTCSGFNENAGGECVNVH